MTTWSSLPAKKSSYANRGMDFENLLNASHEMYKKRGIALITKIPTAFLPKRSGGVITSTIVRQKSICDYLGIAHGLGIAVEAKSVQNKNGTIRYDAVRPHQGDFLSAWESNGGKSLILLAFGLDKFLCLPWAWWKHWQDTVEADSKTKKSFHYEDFPVEFRFQSGGRVPVDYLQVAGVA